MSRAFDAVLDRLLEANNSLHEERSLHAKTTYELQQAKTELTTCVGRLSEETRARADNEKVHKTLLDLRALFMGFFTAPENMNRSQADLLMRLDRAIRDTDEIPF